jgi:glycosyltransferase involved in cell wall biosynthesis
LVNAFQKKLTVNGREVKLILAGGESPTQGQKTHYHEFYSRLYKKILNNPNIIHTGFVPDSLVKTYFSASDLAILPYRTFMSASGPLALAIAFNRPFIASKKLNNYTDFTFNNNHVSIRNLIRKVLSNKELHQKITKHSKSMRLERDFNNQGQLYLDIVKKS